MAQSGGFAWYQFSYDDQGNPDSNEKRDVCLAAISFSKNYTNNNYYPNVGGGANCNKLTISSPSPDASLEKLIDTSCVNF